MADGNNLIEDKKCPFRRVETVKGIINRTKETHFKKCLGERCPYYREWGIFCEKAIKRGR